MPFDEAKEHQAPSGVQTVAVEGRFDRQITSQDLSAGALSFTTNIAEKFRLLEVLIHISVGITETITVKFNSLTGADYDTIITSLDLSNEQNVALVGGENMYGVYGEEGDEIDILCTNNNLTGIVYVMVLSQIIT